MLEVIVERGNLQAPIIPLGCLKYGVVSPEDLESGMIQLMEIINGPDTPDSEREQLLLEVGEMTCALLSERSEEYPRLIKGNRLEGLGVTELSRGRFRLQ